MIILFLNCLFVYDYENSEIEHVFDGTENFEFYNFFLFFDDLKSCQRGSELCDFKSKPTSEVIQHNQIL